MKMMHRFVLLALVVAALVQPAMASPASVEFDLDESTDAAAYEDTIPVGTVPEASAAQMSTAASPVAPDGATPLPQAAPEKAALLPRDIPLIETQNAVTSIPELKFVTGGIGEDEVQSITASKGEYSLHVTNADTSGAYVGDARVIITRKHGNAVEVVLDIVSGPLLYVGLPAGDYVMEASLGEQKKRQAFSLKNKASRTIDLRWK